MELGTAAAMRGKKDLGQVWTPVWVAEALVAYALGNGATELFDPAVGSGALLLAGRRLRGRDLALCGVELDAAALEEARAATDDDLRGVALGNFITATPDRFFDAIVANPPYIRGDRIAEDTVAAARATYNRGGIKFDKRSGLYGHFLIAALLRLSPGGVLPLFCRLASLKGSSRRLCGHG